MFALPAARAPPASVTSRIRTDGSPRSASSIVGMVVTSSSSMILGLVSANREDAIGLDGAAPGDRDRGQGARGDFRHAQPSSFGGSRPVIVPVSTAGGMAGRAGAAVSGTAVAVVGRNCS